MLCLAYRKISVSRQDSPPTILKSTVSLLTSASKKPGKQLACMDGLHAHKLEETALPLSLQSAGKINLRLTGLCLSSASSVLPIPKWLLPIRTSARKLKLERHGKNSDCVEAGSHHILNSHGPVWVSFKCAGKPPSASGSVTRLGIHPLRNGRET